MIGMPKLSDQGMQQYQPPAPRKPITRAPKPYAQPIPAGPTNPVWTPSPTVTNSPYYPQVAAAPSNPGINYGNTQGSVNTSFGGGGGGAITAQSAAPAAPAAPPMSDADWLAGDTEYQNEIKGYDDTLKDFLARITTQETDFKGDYDTALRGFGRNRQKSELGLGEDFTARGLANSGMFNKAQDDLFVQNEDQLKGMTTAKDRGLTDFKNQRSDKERATGTQKGNARRASLSRMAQKQAF